MSGFPPDPKRDYWAELDRNAAESEQLSDELGAQAASDRERQRLRRKAKLSNQLGVLQQQIAGTDADHLSAEEEAAVKRLLQQISEQLENFPAAFVAAVQAA